MIIKFIVNYCLMLGLYIIQPVIGWIYIILTFIYVLKKRKAELKFYLISFALFLFSLFLIVNPLNFNESNLGIVTKTSDNYFIFFSNGNSYYVYEVDTNKEIGDILNISGELKELNFSKYESDFDFENYLNNINVFYEIKNPNIENVFLTPIKINALKSFLLSFYEENVQEFIKMYVYSDSSIYSNKISMLGLYSIFSSSGLLIYALLDVLKRILFRFIANKNRIYLPYIIVIPLLFLTNFKIGIIRALLISFNNDILNRKFSREQIYAICLLFCVLINPYYFKTSSFIYSFVLPYLIYYLRCASKVFKYTYRDFIYSLLIQLLFLPISIYYNNIFSFVSIILMIFFKDVLGVIYAITYLLLLLPFLNFITSYVCNFIIYIIDILSNISLSLYYDISFVFIFIYYVIFIIIILFFEKREIKKGFICSSVLFSLILFSSSSINTYFYSYISFIDVGQGDAILIHDKSNDVLIDTGGNKSKDIANDVLIPYFKKKGIKNLDYVFLSHSDYDHSGAFDVLSSNFQVKNYVIGSKFDFIEVGDLRFINLNRYGDGSLENDDSSVIKLNFYNTTYLFTGDISNQVEEKLIKYEDVSADVLKVAHHGSKYSSSYDFLKKINCKIAVISVGENNFYNHPSNEVINRLNSLNIKTYRTDLLGTITFDKYIKKYY